MKRIKKYIAVLVMAAVLGGVFSPAAGIKAEAAQLSQVDMIIAFARSLTGSKAYNGYCQRFVRVCYEAAGIYATEYVSNSNGARSKWMVSTSKENIPVGAVLYFYTSAGGHSAIYLGNNRMIHGRVTVFEQEITPGFWAIFAGWGWQAGIQPTGTYTDRGTVLTGNIWNTNELLNMREGAGTSFSVLTRIPKNTKLSISQTKLDDDTLWGKTTYYSYHGWVALEYCEFLYTTAPDGINTATGSGKTVESVDLKDKPVKHFYKQGERIDTARLSLFVKYEDGTSGIVTEGFTINNPKAGSAGRSTVIISYEGFVVKYPIIVLSEKSDTALLAVIDSQEIRISADGTALLVFARSFTVQKLHELTAEGTVIYDINGIVKGSGELATGDYAVLMDENDPAVVAICRTGDINGSGAVTAADYLIVKRAFLGSATVDPYFANAGDINGDGKVSSYDYIAIKRHILGTNNIYVNNRQGGL